MLLLPVGVRELLQQPPPGLLSIRAHVPSQQQAPAPTSATTTAARHPRIPFVVRCAHLGHIDDALRCEPLEQYVHSPSEESCPVVVPATRTTVPAGRDESVTRDIRDGGPAIGPMSIRRISLLGQPEASIEGRPRSEEHTSELQSRQY